MDAPDFPNSAVVRVPERLVLKGGRWTRIDLPVRYGVFEHPVQGTCLIDTGYTEHVTRAKGRSLPLRVYAGLLRPQLADTALPRAKVDPMVVLLTHLHADHVSGLRNYPDARIYAHGGGVEHFLQAGWYGRTRHGVFAELLPDDLMARLVATESLPEVDGPLGLGACHDVFGDGSVLCVPLPGHMRGHVGFVFPNQSPPLLYAGDATWLARAIREGREPGPPARWILDNVAETRESAQKLLAFAAAGGRVVHCHDPEPV